MDAGLSFLDCRHPYLDIAHILDDPIELSSIRRSMFSVRSTGSIMVSIYMGRLRSGKEACNKMLVIVFDGPVGHRACCKRVAHARLKHVPFANMAR